MNKRLSDDVIVIGAGLAGLSAACYAVQAGARVRVIAQGWGQQMVAPGWLSFWDATEEPTLAALQKVAADHPEHPYALLGDAPARALEAFQRLTRKLALPYLHREQDGRNWRLPTALGALQTPYAAPRGLAQGDLTDFAGELLIVGVGGWRDFYPDVMARQLQTRGIAARVAWIDVPLRTGKWDWWPNDLARFFDRADVRRTVARQLRGQVRGVSKVGFPAILGLDRHAEALADLSAYLGRQVFEIATLPPSVPGVRLTNALRRWLLRKGARVQVGHAVTRALLEDERCTGVEVAALGHVNTFLADHVILATGGLYNGGIQSNMRGELREPIFGLPVVAPTGTGRADWFKERLLDAQGHPIHRAGVRVNARMQPLNAEGAPALTNVHAAGELLAGFDPLTDGCAEGVALATAWRAVHAALDLD